MSRAKLPMILGIVLVALMVVVGGVVLLRTHYGLPGDLPLPVPVPAAPTLLNRPPAQPAATVPASPTPAPSSAQSLLGELNAALPKLGVPPPVRITEATVDNKLLILTFSAEFRAHLTDLSALDELTAALSSRVLARGYQNLELRVLNAQGRSQSVAELTATPPARRPRPEPIDDGVRR